MNSSLKAFLSYYCPYRRTLFLDLLCASVVAGILLIYPLCAGYVTRTVLDTPGPGAWGQLVRVGLFMLGLLAVQIAANTFVDYQGHMMGTFIERDMRRDLFAHLQKQSFGFFDSRRTGQLMSRVTNDLFDVGELAHHGPEDLFIAVLLFAGVFVILLTLNPALTLLLFAFLPFMAAYAIYFNVRLNRALLQSRAHIADVNAQVEDTLAGIRVVQSFAGERLEQRRFNAENERFVHSRRAGYRADAFFYQGMTLFTQLMSIAVLVFGGLYILRDSLTLPELVTYLMCVGILMEPIRRFVNLARLLQEGVTGFQRFRELMRLEPEIRDTPDAQPMQKPRGDIEFRDVSFQYPGTPRPVLRNINLNIRSGEFVALVGASGVGKSTLCALIPRFYEVTGGEIRLDGTPIRDLTLESLRRSIGVVQQDVYLFSGTVMENIRYGNPDATPSEIIEAAKQAGAHDFITALPDGYDTDIGQRGVKLSGGQKQRLSIARVFLKDPSVLIFDEATSALDNESERVVQESLERLAAHRTTLVIAHRLSTVRNAGRIVVLTENGIAEQGTHDQLMQQDGVYAQLQAVGARL
ncbi:ABC transporter ATP-binding protein [Deinococcus cavernae]|uniref:ABC transporter ATP-binding protein n=1 Tax=Deinococcus cavernae TaxID=2320857 RepID=A0A418V8U9_9DEIO|nr:ABC transporter ATP-binding protein [Deinococcus cavernae]RJF72482.1 ABC transporter ATP-binding protein [Deinococcus cavernae]